MSNGNAIPDAVCDQMLASAGKIAPATEVFAYAPSGDAEDVARLAMFTERGYDDRHRWNGFPSNDWMMGCSSYDGWASLRRRLDSWLSDKPGRYPYLESVLERIHNFAVELILDGDEKDHARFLANEFGLDVDDYWPRGKVPPLNPEYD